MEGDLLLTVNVNSNLTKTIQTKTLQIKHLLRINSLLNNLPILAITYHLKTRHLLFIRKMSAQIDSLLNNLPILAITYHLKTRHLLFIRKMSAQIAKHLLQYRYRFQASSSWIWDKMLHLKILLLQKLLCFWGLRLQWLLCWALQVIIS